MSLDVRATHAKMVALALMQLTNILATVLEDIVEDIAKQVSKSLKNS